MVVVLSSKAGMRAPSGREGFEVLQLALHARELLCGVDGAGGGTAEVDKVAEVFVRVERRADSPPCGGRLVQALAREVVVVACQRDEALHVGEPGDEYGGTVRGADGLERDGAQLGIGLLRAPQPRQRLGPGEARR